jgi:hypothetical protein
VRPDSDGFLLLSAGGRRQGHRPPRLPVVQSACKGPAIDRSPGNRGGDRPAAVHGEIRACTRDTPDPPIVAEPMNEGPMASSAPVSDSRGT